jgi:hypothetical protein
MNMYSTVLNNFFPQTQWDAKWVSCQTQRRHNASQKSKPPCIGLTHAQLGKVRTPNQPAALVSLAKAIDCHA